jgi:sugar/nucleoside kinase (ribokinase family)
MAGPELLCIGNALVDVFARNEEDIDLRFGLDSAVQHIEIERLQEILSVLPEFTVCSGGGAANVAKISGFLGVNVGFLGAVGSGLSHQGQADRFGKLFEKELTEAGVQTCLVRKKTPTGICLMLHLADGRVKIAASPSAALELSEDDLDEELISRARVVILDGFMLGRETLVRRILALANKHGTAVALDVSSMALAAERALEIVTYARAYPLIIFMNEDESKAFYRALCAGRDMDESIDPLGPEMVNLFKNFTANDIFPILTVKLGIRGAVVFAGGNVYREETIPIIPLETTGAGDAFCAAFLASWVRDKSLSACAGLGNRVAREVLEVPGTRITKEQFKPFEKLLR